MEPEKFTIGSLGPLEAPGKAAADPLEASNNQLSELVDALAAQRRRYQELFDSAPDAYLVTDPDGIIHEANRAASLLLSLPVHQLQGRPLAEFMSGQSRGAFQGQLERLSRGERLAHWEVDVDPRGGEPVPVTISTSTVSTGDAPEIRWLLRDVRALREAEEQEARLRMEHAGRVASERAEREARFLASAGESFSEDFDLGATAQAVADFAVPTLGDYCVVYLARGSSIHPGAVSYARPDAAATVAALLRYCPQPGAAAGVARVLRTGEPDVVHVVDKGYLDRISVSADHRALLEELDARSELVVPLSARGQNLGALLVGSHTPRNYGMELMLAEDFADRAALALDNARVFEEVRRAREAAEEASRAKSEFLATISHELRTPLAAVMGYAELLATGVPEELPETARHYVDRILFCVRHQRALVEQVLECARMEGGPVTVERELVDVCELVAATVDMIEPEAGNKGLEVIRELPPSPLEISTDRGKLRQILVNLLSNAVRFTETGSIRVELGVGPEGVEVRVEDTGVGIPAERLDQIFERFWQVDQSSTRRHGGMGLGLTIARQLARLLGGDVEVASELGEGTTFTLRLPGLTPL